MQGLSEYLKKLAAFIQAPKKSVAEAIKAVQAIVPGWDGDAATLDGAARALTPRARTELQKAFEEMAETRRQEEELSGKFQTHEAAAGKDLALALGVLLGAGGALGQAVEKVQKHIAPTTQGHS